MHHRLPLLIMIAGIVLTLPIISSFFFAGAPENVSGATIDKLVYGVVYDGWTSQPLAGASVTAEIWGGYWPEQDFFRTSESTVTNSVGYYEVVIDANHWSPHNTIRVITICGLAQGSCSVEADGESAQEVNVHTETIIPEFGGSLGMLVMVGCVAPFVLLRHSSVARRKRGLWVQEETIRDTRQSRQGAVVMLCPICGAENDQKALFCQNCGKGLAPPAIWTNPSRKPFEEERLAPKGGLGTGSPIQQQSGETVRILRRIEMLLGFLLALGLLWFFAWLFWIL